MEFMNILRYFYPYVSMWLPTLMTNQQQWNQKQTTHKLLFLRNPDTIISAIIPILRIFKIINIFYMIS